MQKWKVTCVLEINLRPDEPKHDEAGRGYNSSTCRLQTTKNIFLCQRLRNDDGHVDISVQETFTDEEVGETT